jgi:hypothetical protein
MESLCSAAAEKKVRRELAASEEAAGAISAELAQLEAQAEAASSAGGSTAGAGLFGRQLKLLDSLRQRLHSRVRGWHTPPAPAP